MSTPIADLTYRHYDGALESPTKRWWVIARQLIRMNVKKKWFWGFSFLSGGYYFLLIIVTFFVEQLTANQAPAGAPGGANPAATFFQQFMERIVWKDQFMHGLSFGQIWMLAMALMVGIGTIANDNRANALLVYLSKPCNKKDYLIGKWMGIFLMMMMGIFPAALFFFLYGTLSYRQFGFLSDDPWLLPKVMLIVPLVCAFHASLAVGISSLFNQGRLAGATYAGIYFITNFFTQVIVGIWVNVQQGDAERMAPFKPMLQSLYYASVDGLNIGLIKAVLDTNGSPWLGIDSRIVSVPRPDLLPILLICGGLSALSLFIAWRRIRAVEVVG